MILLYIILSLLWGIMAVGMQRKLLHSYSSNFRCILVFIVNTLLFPISLIYAGICLNFNIGFAKYIKI